MKKLLNTTLLSLLILSFTSCNTNDKDELIICIEEITKLLPTTIEINYLPMPTHSEVHSYEYVYDDANKLVNETYVRKIDFESNPTVTLTTQRKFNYNTKGQLSSINQKYTSSNPTEIENEINNRDQIFAIQYDEVNNTVTYSGNKVYSSTFHINKNGVPYKSVPTDNSGYVTTYEYDDYSNLLQLKYVDTKNNVEMQKTTITYYTNILSPFAYSNLPAWYMTTQLDLYMLGILNLATTGKNMIEKERFNNSASIVHYKVKESTDGYPTKIEKFAGEEETTYETISITYKKIN